MNILEWIFFKWKDMEFRVFNFFFSLKNESIPYRVPTRVEGTLKGWKGRRQTCIPVLRATLHHSQEIETTPMTANWWTNKMWLEYHTVMKRNEAQKHSTARSNVENIVLNERSQIQKVTCYMIWFTWNVQKTADEWLPGAGRIRYDERLLKFPFEVMKVF